MTTTNLTWSRPRSLDLRRVSFSKIDVPEEYERKDLVEDDALRKSIQASGIQQPLVLLSNGSRFTLVKGGRRMRVAEDLGLSEALALVYDVPQGIDEKVYRDRLRSILTRLRQDLPPSQRASLIRQVMNNFGMSQKEIASMIGLDPGSVSNFLAIEQYRPEIRALIDKGEINSFQARSFDGLNDKGQLTVLKRFGKELRSMPGDKLHRLIRSKVSPKQHPDFYTNPEKTAERLARKKVGRKARRRPRITRNEKEALSKSVEVAEIELRDLTSDITKWKKGCMLAGPPINAILRNQRLVSLIKKEVPEFLPELERYSEIY